MPDRQRIFVVSTSADQAELRRLRSDLGRDHVVLVAPTAEAKAAMGVLGVEPRVETLLAPVRFPAADRGHQLDDLVRRAALEDRWRDVVVVTDAATSTLVRRVLAPDQLPPSGAVTLVGLPRGDRPVAVRRGLALGLVLGVAASVAESLALTLVLLALVAVTGLVLSSAASWRHLGRELVLAASAAVVVALVVVASAARFPGGW